MVKRSLLLLALAATHSAFAVSAAGSAAPRPDFHAAADKYQAWRTAATAALIARADANSLATAAALRYTGPGGGSLGGALKPTAVDLAARASELAPQDASIGWLHLQLCWGTPGCDIRDVATVVRWVDADNGAAWLHALTVAHKDRDPIEVDRILADMAQGGRFDFYWNRIVVMMVDALDAARDRLPNGVAASDSARLATVSAIAISEVIPPVVGLQEACRESSPAAERRELWPERRDLCLKLSKIMQRGDTVAAQMAGFSIERRLLAADGKETRAIAERRHVLEWRVAAAAKFDDPLLPWTKNAHARARLAHMRALPREEDVCIAILREHKMALDPPEVHP
jgi:hypothetical protein